MIVIDMRRDKCAFRPRLPPEGVEDTQQEIDGEDGRHKLGLLCTACRANEACAQHFKPTEGM
jgi:hypothetical protein